MARKIAVEIVGDSSSLERAFKRSTKSAQAFSGQIDNAGKTRQKFFSGARAVAGGAAAAMGFAGATDLIKKSISGASNLNEVLNKTRAIFGDASKEVLDWSKNSANSMGLAQREALDAASSLGGMFDATKKGSRASAEMSERMVQLAADMASFNDEDPSEMLEKLRSGLAGEAEPLRKYNAFLSEARVKQEAYRSGIAKQGAELTEGQKIQARYNLILKDTAKQHGDFQRTSGSLANQQRILTANLTDLSDRLGKILTPAVTDLISKLTDWIGKSKNQQTIIDSLKAAAATLGTALNVLKGIFGVLSTAVGGNANAIKVLIGAYAGFKILGFASRIGTLAGSFRGLRRSTINAAGATSNFRRVTVTTAAASGGLRGSINRTSTATGNLGRTTAKTAGKTRGFRASANKLGQRLGPAGLVAETLLASYTLTTFALKLTHLDKVAYNTGAAMYDLAGKIGLVNDQMDEYRGKADITPKRISGLRLEAANLKSRGLSGFQAYQELVRRHPGVAKPDLAAAVRMAPQIHIGNVTVNATNPTLFTDQLIRHSRRRARKR